MKALIILSSLFLTSIASAQGETISSVGCGQTKPRYCVDEPVIVKYKDVYNRNQAEKATIAGFNTNGTYSVKYPSGGVASGFDVGKLYKTKGCGLPHEGTGMKFCGSSEPIIYSYKDIYNRRTTAKATIEGVSSDGMSYVVDVSGGLYVDVGIGQLFKTKGCSKTRPRFCADESVVANYRDVYNRVQSMNGEIAGFNSEGEFTVISEKTLWGQVIQISALSKIRSSSASLSCEGIDAFLSDSTADIVNTYNSLAKVTTAERAEYLKNVSQYLGAMNRPDANLFARFVIGKIIRSSTAKVVQDSFKKAADADLVELQKTGWKSIDQIEANSATLDFAMRVLFASVKLRLSMPEANASLKSFASRLTIAASEQKLSAKITTLQAIIKDMQPMLNELMNDPRHQSLGEVTQEVAGWVLKN